MRRDKMQFCGFRTRWSKKGVERGREKARGRDNLTAEESSIPISAYPYSREDWVTGRLTSLREEQSPDRTLVTGGTFGRRSGNTPIKQITADRARAMDFN